MSLNIDKKHFDLIKAYGEGSYPDECCGFLLGKQNDGDKAVLSMFPSNNAREKSEQFHRFLITPENYLQVDKYAKEKNMDIIGFYHSHPNAEAKPSSYDLKHGWPWYSYIIVSVKNKQAEKVTSWTMMDDRSKFKEEKIIVMNYKRRQYCDHTGIDSNSPASIFSK